MPVMHQAVKAYLANQRQGNAATKTRSFVAGGNQKPWKQKGTGRARQGSTRAPHWPGGGTVFGPLPRDYDRKCRARCASSPGRARSTPGRARTVSRDRPVTFEAPKTTLLAELLGSLGVEGRRCSS